MYPNKKTEQTCRLVTIGGGVLVLLSLISFFALKAGKKANGFPGLRKWVGYGGLCFAGIMFIAIGIYGIREQLHVYFRNAFIGMGLFFFVQILSCISFYMNVKDGMSSIAMMANIFFCILGLIYCVFFSMDFAKRYANMRYDQMVLAVLVALGVIAGVLLFIGYNGGEATTNPNFIATLEKSLSAFARAIIFILPAAMLWFCDRLTEPFTDNEVAQVRVAERQAVKLSEAQRMTEQYNKESEAKAAARRRKEQEVVEREAAARRRLEEEKQARIEAEKRAAELEVQKAKEKAEREAREAEEQAKRAAEEEVRRQEEIKRQLEEAQRAAEEAQRRAEEEAKRAAEAAEEARRKAEEEVRKAQAAQEEARRRAEQLRENALRKAETLEADQEEIRRKAEQMRESALRKAEAAKAEAAKKEEEIRRKQAAEAAAKAEQIRIDEEEKAKNEELERRRAEVEARRREKEAQRRLEAEQRRLEEEALAAMTPEERKIYEEEKALMEQEEALRRQDEEARAEALREVEAYRRAEEELRASAEEETRKKIETLQMALNAGLITKEEFEARKAKILN